MDDETNVGSKTVKIRLWNSSIRDSSAQQINDLLTWLDGYEYRPICLSARVVMRDDQSKIRRVQISRDSTA